jgi:hypothetical protein
MLACAALANHPNKKLAVFLEKSKKELLSTDPSGSLSRLIFTAKNCSPRGVLPAPTPRRGLRDVEPVQEKTSKGGGAFIGIAKIGGLGRFGKEASAVSTAMAVTLMLIRAPNVRSEPERSDRPSDEALYAQRIRHYG